MTLRPSERAPGLWLGEDVSLPEGVFLGANIVIHPGVKIEEGCTIQDGAIVGKQPVLGPHSRAQAPRAGTPTLLERGSQIGSHAVLVAGARVHREAVVGDHAFIREEAELGAEVVVGGGCQVGTGVAVGARSKLMNSTLVARGTVIEEDVFCGPAVTITNDPTLGRHQGRNPVLGAVLRRGCRLGAGAILLPGVEIGEEAVVAAGSLVTRSVAPRALVMGVPARPVRTIGDEELLELFQAR